MVLMCHGDTLPMREHCYVRSNERWMRDALERRRDEGTLRELRTAEGDYCFVDFTSNDYLGLGRSNELRLEIEREEVRARKVNKRMFKSTLCIALISLHSSTLYCNRLQHVQTRALTSVVQNVGSRVLMMHYHGIRIRETEPDFILFSCCIV